MFMIDPEKYWTMYIIVNKYIYKRLFAFYILYDVFFI